MGTLDAEYIFISERFTVDNGYRMGKELLKKEILPTALCVASAGHTGGGCATGFK